jgi:hypothetical protein
MLQKPEKAPKCGSNEEKKMTGNEYGRKQGKLIV